MIKNVMKYLPSETRVMADLTRGRSVVEISRLTNTYVVNFVSDSEIYRSIAR